MQRRWFCSFLSSSFPLSRRQASPRCTASGLNAVPLTDSKPITVVVFQGETRALVLQRHRELRPDHAGRPVRFEFRNVERDDVREMFAVHTPEELRAVLDHIEAEGCGLTVGQRMLRDAHRWDAD
jgi:hypothetical protein